ncbi:hypothetical protein Hanom_Chr09g00859781 [Helianthus anomalus]
MNKFNEFLMELYLCSVPKNHYSCRLMSLNNHHLSIFDSLLIDINCSWMSSFLRSSINACRP